MPRNGGAYAVRAPGGVRPLKEHGNPRAQGLRGRVPDLADVRRDDHATMRLMLILTEAPVAVALQGIVQLGDTPLVGPAPEGGLKRGLGRGGNNCERR